MALESAAAIRWERLVVQVAAAAAVWAALLLAGAIWWADESAGAVVSRIGWPLWLATLAAFAVSHLLRFVRWHWMLAEEGYVIPAARGLAIFLAGLGLLPTPGKAGVAIRSLLLRREGVPVNVSLAAYFSERLFDLLGLIALASLVLATEPGHRWMAALLGGAAGVAAVRVSPRCCHWLALRLRGHERISRSLAWSQQFLEHASRLVAGRLFVPFLLLGIAANAVIGLLLWLALSHLGAPIAVEEAEGIVGVSHLSGSLSLLPGGLGGFELAMLGQLSALAVAAPSAIAALVLVRLATIWGSVAVGLPLLAYGLRGADSALHANIVDRTIPDP